MAIWYVDVPESELTKGSGHSTIKEALADGYAPQSRIELPAEIASQRKQYQMAVKDEKAAVEPSASVPDSADQTPVKWFGSREKADAFIAKKGMADTHEVVANGKRFDIKAKDQAAAPVKQAKPVEVGQRLCLAKAAALAPSWLLRVILPRSTLAIAPRK